MKKQFEILDKEIVYPGFFRMEKYRLKHTDLKAELLEVFTELQKHAERF